MFIAVVVHQGSGLQHGHTDASVYALKGVSDLSLCSFRVSEIPEARFQRPENSPGSNYGKLCTRRGVVHQGSGHREERQSNELSCQFSVVSFQIADKPLLLTYEDKQHLGSWRSLLTHHRIGRRPEGLLSIQAPPSGSRAESLVIGFRFRVQN